MISYSYGTLQGWDNQHVIIIPKGTGIGFSVKCTPRAVDGKKVGDQIELYIHTHFTQNNIELFGFSSPLEREIFRKLISVSGIGTRIALSLLGEFDAIQLVEIVLQQDLKSLTKAKGVGNKVAKRIIRELEEVFQEFGGLPTPDLTKRQMGIVQDVEGALKSLGYGKHEISQVVTEINSMAKQGFSTEEILQTILPKMTDSLF